MRIQKIKQAIENLKPWISSEEMGLIALNSGYEGTFRDRLLLPLQKKFPQYVVRSEYHINKNRADIAILDEKGIKCIIELKHNYTFQLELLTGKKGKYWKNNTFPDKLSQTRVESEFARWEASQVQLFCISLVSHFDSIDSTYEKFLKYKALLHKNNAFFHKYYSEYLNSHQIIPSIYNLQLKEPYSASGRLMISIFQNKG